MLGGGGVNVYLLKIFRAKDRAAIYNSTGIKGCVLLYEGVFLNADSVERPRFTE